MPGGVHPPLSEILSWPKANYDHPESHGVGMPVVAIFFAVLSTVLVSLRLYARIWLIRQPGVDDLLIVIGLIFAIYLSVTTCIGYYHYSIGLHIWDVRLTTYGPARLNTWLCEYGTVISTSCTKISILLFYQRLASGSYTNWFLWGVRVGVAFNAANCLAWILYIALECTPIDAYWKQFDFNYDKKWTCANEHISLPISGVLSIIGDFYATMLPALLLRNLQIPRKQKLLLYALFASGFIVVAAGIVRTVYMDKVINRSYDTTWTLWVVWLWTLVEIYLAIICACLPALKPLFVAYVAPTVVSTYNYAISRQSVFVSTASRRSAATKSRTPSSRGFTNISAHSHTSTTKVMGGAAGLGYGKGCDSKNVELKIVVRSDIEQVEEQTNVEELGQEQILPLQGTWGDGGGKA